MAVTTSPAVTSVARRAKVPAVTAGAAAAGLAGGLVVGTRLASSRSRHRVLGLPIGRRSGAAVAAMAVADGARRVVSLANDASKTVDEVRQAREQLENLNRRSPIEVVLDGLTHRRGAHRREG
jgi:hypothetical protein